jgi:Zn finger protein HypA/HybF involved in hydrogenase expression
MENLKMKFLKKIENDDSDEPQIVVQKLIKLNLECQFCGVFAQMEGGPTEEEKAQFACPECNRINTIKWRIDI